MIKVWRGHPEADEEVGGTFPSLSCQLPDGTAAPTTRVVHRTYRGKYKELSLEHIGQ